MSEIPVTLTFDNIALLAVKELEAPLLVRIKEIDFALAKLYSEQSDIEETNYPNELMAAITKKHKALIGNIKKIAKIEINECHAGTIKLNIVPLYKDAEGELTYSLSLNKKELGTLKTLKQLKECDRQIDKLEDEQHALKHKVRSINDAQSKVKLQMMDAITSSNIGHLEFKKLVKQKISNII